MENKELNITYRPIKELKPYKKNAKKRIPKFVDDCMSLYKAFTSVTVKMSEMVELTEEYEDIMEYCYLNNITLCEVKVNEL